MNLTYLINKNNRKFKINLKKKSIRPILKIQKKNFHQTCPLNMYNNVRATLKNNNHNLRNNDYFNLSWKNSTEYLETNSKLDNLSNQFQIFQSSHYEKLQNLQDIVDFTSDLESLENNLDSKINDLDISLSNRLGKLEESLSQNSNSSISSIESLENSLDSKIKNLNDSIDHNSKITENLKKELKDNEEKLKKSINFEFFNITNGIKKLLIGSSVIIGISTICVGGFLMIKNNNDLISNNNYNLECLRIQKEILQMKYNQPIQVNTKYIIKPTEFIIEKVIKIKYDE